MSYFFKLTPDLDGSEGQLTNSLTNMAPSASADNGGFAWLVTIRPRPEHFTDELIDAVKAYLEKIKPDWHLCVIEKGNHIHAAVFMHKPDQRSNFITKWLNGPLKDWDDAEKKNFRRYDRENKTGAVLNMTTLGIVAEYLSGEYKDKINDEFEVLSEHLPAAEDISELEEYLPAVDGLKRKRQMSVWYAQMEEEFYKLKKDSPIPGITDQGIHESSILKFVQHKMYVARDMDVIADERILQQKVRALVAYMSSTATGRYQDPGRNNSDQLLEQYMEKLSRQDMPDWMKRRERKGACLNCGKMPEACHC